MIELKYTNSQRTGIFFAVIFTMVFVVGYVASISGFDNLGLVIFIGATITLWLIVLLGLKLKIESPI